MSSESVKVEEKSNNKTISIKESLLKQRKPQWAINLVNEYIDVKEEEVSHRLSDLQHRLKEIHEENSLKLRLEIDKTIRDFKDDMINWRNENYLDNDDLDYSY